MTENELIDIAIQASLNGGKEILKVYSSDFAIQAKEDRSPLTLADTNAHKAIVELLEPTEIPIISEEGKETPYEERSQWQTLWIVDPLDGTKEFIKRNGEFTVNIALVKNGRPVGGVIYVPVRKELYYANEDGSKKVEKIDCDEDYDIVELKRRAVSLPKDLKSSAYRVVGSRSHMSEETEAFISQLKKEHDEIEIVSMGSSLKICLVAEGMADVYPRFAPTMEWDTAAGHAIVSGAGKQLIDHATGEEMKYNRKELLNNWFIVR